MQGTPEPTTQDAPAASDAGATGAGTKKRPRLDMAVDSRERKRGKTMFGLLLGTLNKAKNEDKERNASDAVRLSVLCDLEHADLLCAFSMSLALRVLDTSMLGGCCWHCWVVGLDGTRRPRRGS